MCRNENVLIFRKELFTVTEKITFNKSSFVNKIKVALQNLESETETKLRSLMTAEAKSKADTNFANPIKKFKDAVNIYSTNGTAVSKNNFPDGLYVAVMQRVVAVEAPKISGGSLNEGYIIKQIGAYISDLLNTKTETVTVGQKKYTLSNPIGSTVSTVTVSVGGNKYIFSWNDDTKARESLNSFMKSLAAFEKENLTAVFFALLKDAKKFTASSNSNSSGSMISNWIKTLMSGGKAKSMSNLSGFEYFRQLSLKLKSTAVTGDLISLATDVFDTLKPFLEIYKSLQSPNKNAKKLLDKIESLRGKAESVKQFMSFTKEIFTGNGNTIASIVDKYDKLLEKATALAAYIDEHDISSAESLAKLSAYKNFVAAFNNLTSAISTSSTDFTAMLDECKIYEYSDVNNAVISQNRALISGNGNDNKIWAEGTSVTLNGNAGDDTLTASGRYSYVNGGQGDDLIYVEGNFSSVNGSILRYNRCRGVRRDG